MTRVNKTKCVVVSLLALIMVVSAFITSGKEGCCKQAD